MRDLLLLLSALYLISGESSAQSASTLRYDIGSPALVDYWVDPISGSDSNDGRSRNRSFQTVTRAWNEIPEASVLSTGVRVNLLAGEYPVSSLPNYWESRYGTFAAPIILRAFDGSGTAVFRSGPNMYDVRYVYFIGVRFVPDPAGDAFHCELCDHLLLREVEASGGSARQAQESVKINQSSHIYIEGSNIHGAYDNAIDFVSVQYGHIVDNRIHNAGDWCAYVKGGSAYLRIESNRIYNCGTGGFTAGQGSGFEFMVSPLLHYEAYDVKFINNLIYDTDGAGMGVNGGYNILLAHNTLFRVGSRSHGIEIVFGYRSCDGDVSACSTRLSAGGWGTSITGTEGEPIPNRNVFVYNNLLYNPIGIRSQWQHFAIYGPRTVSGGSNIPNPARADTNLQIRGNVIWNGDSDLPLGVEDFDQGCMPSNPSCNAVQLRGENSMNTQYPTLRDPESGDLRPAPESSLFSAPTFTIPDFPGGDLPTTPVVTPGELQNIVATDRSGVVRLGSSPPGAYANTDSPLDGSDNDLPSGIPPSISGISCNPRIARRGTRLTCSAVVRDDSAVERVTVTFNNRYARQMKLKRGRYRATWRVPRLRATNRIVPEIAAIDDADQTRTTVARRIRYSR